MRLKLLGTTGYHPNQRRHTLCMLLAEQGIVLDAGTGMFRLRDELATDELDVFLTHAHLDHISGLTYLLGILKGRDIKRVTVHGEQEKLDAINKHLFAELIFPVAPSFEFRPLGDKPITLPGDGRLAYFPLKHPGGTVGYRLQWPGHSMAYVTDTTAAPDAAYIDEIRGVDLLVHECFFPDEMQDLAELTGHSHTTPVANVAHEAGVGQLVLVHMDPADTSADPIGIATARAIFPNTTLGEDEMAIEF